MTPVEMYRQEKAARALRGVPTLERPTPPKRRARFLGVRCPKVGDRREYDAAYYAAHGERKRAKAREYKARKRAERSECRSTPDMGKSNVLSCGRGDDA